MCETSRDAHRAGVDTRRRATTTTTTTTRRASRARARGMATAARGEVNFPASTRATSRPDGRSVRVERRRWVDRARRHGRWRTDDRVRSRAIGDAAVRERGSVDGNDGRLTPTYAGSTAREGRRRIESELGTSTTEQAGRNVTNILLGVGTLGVPYALKEAGWSGLIVLGTLGLVTNYTGKILIACQRRGTLPASERSTEGAGGSTLWSATGVVGDDVCPDEFYERPAERALTSYEDIGEAAFGKLGRNFITSVLYTELIGTAGLFFILEGDHLATLFHAKGKEELFACAAALFMVPTTWLFDLSKLSYVGALGLYASTVLTGVVSYELIHQYTTTGSLPHLAETTFVNWSTFPVSFGLLAFVYAGHAVFPAIYASMEKPEEYEKMLDESYIVVGLNCLALGCAGYASFGNEVSDQVTLSLDAGALATLAFGLTAINPFAKFALTLDPVAKGVDSKLGFRVRDSKSDALVSRLLRTALGVLTLGAAIKLPFFGVGMSLVGAALTLSVSVTFPSMCYLRMFGDELSRGERWLNYAILGIGFTCAASGTAAAFQSALEISG